MESLHDIMRLNTTIMSQKKTKGERSALIAAIRRDREALMELCSETVKLSALQYDVTDSKMKYVEGDIRRLKAEIYNESQVKDGTGSSTTTNHIDLEKILLDRQIADVVELQTKNDMAFNPNELRYCSCNNVAYGEMIACENEDCMREWFHLQCVGLTEIPEGKWLCPYCDSSNRWRKRRNMY
jgi:hypothetical protein